MIVTFNTMANTSSDPHSAYMNFLRCVTAIATANAGTTSLSVPALVANNVLDSNTNCIVAIVANTEAGGWTTSASHSVPTQSWDASILQNASPSGNYKADFYNSTGKGSYPYMKMSFTLPGASAASTLNTLHNTLPRAKATNLTNVANTAHTAVMVTYGCSNTTDWTSSTYPPVGGNTAYNTGTQTTSFTVNEMATANATNTSVPAFVPHNPGAVYTMAVTSEYCVIWEQAKTSSYANGYSIPVGTSTLIPNQRLDYSYGKLIYCGLRDTQPWEDAQGSNPPFVAMQVTHRVANTNAFTVLNPGMDGFVGAFLTTMSDTGTPTTTASRYFSNDTALRQGVTYDNSVTLTGTARAGHPYQYYAQTVAYVNTFNLGIQIPLFVTRSTGYSTAVTNHLYTPTYDPVTGSFVPPAVPIYIRRLASGSWNGGGAIKGLYKSLEMPLASMKYYFADGQRFTIGNDLYTPIVFHESMYLVRFA